LAQGKRELQRQCPVCQAETVLIIPSDTFITEKDKKRKLAQENKKKMSMIPCKYLKKGVVECPYGTSCNYKHPFN
jgi:E3 ubiquitin-protein ligase makorin